MTKDLLLQAPQRCRDFSLLKRDSGDGKRFVVHADDKLSGFLEAERAIHQFAVSLLS